MGLDLDGNPLSFQDLIRRVREGDQAASTELVRLYEPEIRRIIRVRLTDRRLRQVFDDADICQSVLASFFLRVVLGDFELETPEHLVRLLTTMTRNKIIDKSRKHQPETNESGLLEGAAIQMPSPSRIIAGRDLLSTIRQRLTPEECYLFDQRSEDRPWADLAAELGVEVDTLRKRLTRALERVVQNLGLAELLREGP